MLILYSNTDLYLSLMCFYAAHGSSTGELQRPLHIIQFEILTLLHLIGVWLVQTVEKQSLPSIRGLDIP